MPSYLLLIAEPPGQREARARADARVLYDEMVAYGSALRQRGVLRAMESLRPDRIGARVQVRGGQRRLTDGPFTEAREMIGGFFLIDCGSLGEAVEIAAQCPAAAWATVEVRETGPCHEA